MTYEESQSDKENCCLAGGIYEAAIPCRLGLSTSTINANPLSGHFPPAVHLLAEVNSSPPSMGSPGVIQDFVLHVFFFCQRCSSKNSDRSTEASRMRNDAKTCKNHVYSIVSQITANLYSTHYNALGHLNPAPRSPHDCRHLACPAGHVSPCLIPSTSEENGLTLEECFCLFSFCSNEVHEQNYMYE